MEVTILKCKLKKDVPEGTYVYFEKRNHGSEFEIIDPDPGVELNVSKLCNVEKILTVVPDAVEVTNSEPSKEKEEIIQFANDAWDLAVKYEQELKELSAELERLRKLTPESIQNVVPPKPVPRKKKVK